MTMPEWGTAFCSLCGTETEIIDILSMANHASEISHMRVGSTIYKMDTGKTMSEEDVEEFKEARDALYENCASAYFKSIQDVYGTLTERTLNEAFIQVMRAEPGVINWINTYRAINEATKQVLIK